MEPIKKSTLIDIIQDLTPFHDPHVNYEQYITDAVATADLMFHIAFERGDLNGNLIIDLGCGTGNLSIAAAMLGASAVVAVDIDTEVLATLNHNCAKYNLSERIIPFEFDIRDDLFVPQLRNQIQLLGRNFTQVVVISNPPFGVHQKGIDVLFLKKAFEFADIIYSIHLSNPKSRIYINKKIEKLGGTLSSIAELTLFIKHSYKFHSQERKKIQTDVYRIITQRNPKKE